MIHRKSILGLNAVAAIFLIVAAGATLSSGTTTLNVQAQNSATSQQLVDYLTQAIQAIEDGDNTKAMQQLQLASEQMGTSSGASMSDDESDDDEDGPEEGPGEEEDEPGDTNTNDEED